MEAFKKFPQITGHRGCEYAPENTLAAIHAAADAGAKAVELDVKLTKDGVPIIFHDETLERTTNGEGLVAETIFEDIRKLDAGSWFSESFVGEQIPTLEEALDVILERDLALNLEIKPCDGREEETAEAALDILTQIWDDPKTIYISSYSPLALARAKCMMPSYSRGMVLGKKSPEDWVEDMDAGILPAAFADFAKELQLQGASVDALLASEELLSTLMDMDITPHIYRVNDESTARTVQGYGVQHFISDVPDVASEGLLTIH